MSGTFSSYDIARRALSAFQSALEVTGNNVSNVNTVGYTRQQVQLGQSLSTTGYGLHPLQFGSGVDLQAITQIRDTLLDRSMWTAQSDMGKYQTLANALQSVQGAFPEPGENGIAAALSGFFNAWSGLASNPGNAGAKLTVQQAGATLTQRVRSAYSRLQQQSQQVSSGISSTFDQINGLTAEIAKLNKEIAASVAAGGSPNAQLDQRNLDLQKLSSLVDIQTYNNKDGSVTVYTNSLNLVDQGGASQIPRNFDPTSLKLFDASNSTSIQSGQLAGQIQALNNLKSYMGQLDSLANNLRTQVNAIHSTGKNSLGQTGVLFFNDSNPQTGASNFNLSTAVAADPNAIVSGVSGAAGDGALALGLAHLTTAAVKGLSGKSFGDFYGGLVGQIGSDAQSYNNAVSTQGALVQQIQNQQQSVSGVNVDEEMSNMLRYQRSYQAAAKALSIFDQSTNDLLGIVR